MGLKAGDLKDTVLKRLSIDEYEPKTGEAADVMVFGFHVKESAVGDDLYHFISNSIADVRDVEVSPNPNTDGYYMVFCELDRNQDSLNNIRSIVRDVENVAGELAWTPAHISQRISFLCLVKNWKSLCSLIQQPTPTRNHGRHQWRQKNKHQLKKKHAS